jgi:hypothetical protein
VFTLVILLLLLIGQSDTVAAVEEAKNIDQSMTPRRGDEGFSLLDIRVDRRELNS